MTDAETIATLRTENTRLAAALETARVALEDIESMCKRAHADFNGISIVAAGSVALLARAGRAALTPPTLLPGQPGRPDSAVPLSVAGERVPDVLRALTPEELAARVPISQERIDEALAKGQRDRQLAEAALRGQSPASVAPRARRGVPAPCPNCQNERTFTSLAWNLSACKTCGLKIEWPDDAAVAAVAGEPGEGMGMGTPSGGSTVPTGGTGGGEMLSLSEARGWSARIWCEPQHSAQTMDTELAETIAHQLVYAYNRGHRDGREGSGIVGRHWVQPSAAALSRPRSAVTSGPDAPDASPPVQPVCGKRVWSMQDPTNNGTACEKPPGHAPPCGPAQPKGTT